MYLFSHEGVHFRRLERGDLGLLVDLKNESWASTHNISMLNMDVQSAWYDRMLSEDIHCPKNLILMAFADDDRIGVFKLFQIDWFNRKANAAWDIFLPHRRKGYGTRMVTAGVEFCRRVLHLHRLTAEILVNNLPSMRCADRAGFAREGCKKQDVLRDGHYLDSFVYGAILDEDEGQTKV